MRTALVLQGAGTCMGRTAVLQQANMQSAVSPKLYRCPWNMRCNRFSSRSVNLSSLQASGRITVLLAGQ